MTDNITYSGPNISVPQTMPANTPASIAPFIKPFYVGFQSLLQTFVRYCGIAPRNRSEWLVLNGDPSTILVGNVSRFYVAATEPIAESALVNLYDISSDIVGARMANASDPDKYCNAILSPFGSGLTVGSGLGIGELGEFLVTDGLLKVQYPSVILVPGRKYYLDTTDGQLTDTAPVGPGEIEQVVGFALDRKTLKFWPWPPIQH